MFMACDPVARQQSSPLWHGVLAGALLLASAGTASAQARLTVSGRRVTDEAIARDLRTLREWRTRVDSLPREGAAVARYHRSKAHHWLLFVESEYADNERGPVVDAAFDRVVRLVSAVEGDSTVRDDEGPLPGTQPVRRDLHARLDEHTRRVLSCAPEQVGELAVALVSAAHAPGQVGRMNAAAAIRRAEVLDAALRSTPCGDAVVVVQPASPRAEPVPVTSEPPVAREPVAVRVIVVPGRVHFAFARSTLSSQTRSLLEEVARNLRDMTTVRIEIVGHTDRHGAMRVNQRLGLRRARRVQLFLAAQGIPVDWLRARSAGERQLIDRGTSRAADARNRRVELRIIAGDTARIRLMPDTTDVQVRRR